ncbi:MAG: HAD family hydrolase [Chloroflexi bacterium]|nr:HAD family hydrolase [Chloroflexota bacterium]MDE2703265.1 HAD family hydrolase [Chloroflexota bacterium]
MPTSIPRYMVALQISGCAHRKAAYRLFFALIILEFDLTSRDQTSSFSLSHAPPPPKLLALDVDGTLIASGGQLSQRTIDAVRAAAAAGIRIVIATGRRWRTAQMVLEPLGAGDFLIQSSGAVVRDLDPDRRGRIVYRNYIPREVAVGVCRVALDLGLIPVWYDTPERTRQLYVFGQVAASPQLQIYSRPNPGAFVEKDSFAGLGPALEIVCFGEPGGLAELQRRIDGLPPGNARAMTWSSPRYRGSVLEVVHSGTSKGAALSWLCAKLGVAAEHVAAIGDDVNDIEMLRWSGTAIAVEGAGSAVVSEASHRIAGPAKHGVARLIEGWLEGPGPLLESTGPTADVAQR